MTEIIIGAAIALVSSIVTSFVVYWLDTKRNRQSRVWQLEDRQKTELSEILKVRIDQVENLLNTIKSIAENVTADQTNLLKLVNDKSLDGVVQILFSNDDNLSTKLAFLKQDIEVDFDSLAGKLDKYMEEQKGRLKRPSEILSECNKGLSYVAVLNQDNLTKDVVGFLKTAVEETSHYKDLQSRVSNKETISVQDEIVRIQKYMAYVITYHGSIINRLDAMRVNGKYEEMLNG